MSCRISFYIKKYEPKLLGETFADELLILTIRSQKDVGLLKSLSLAKPPDLAENQAQGRYHELSSKLN